MTPTSGWYIHRHTRATATTDETAGTKNSVRTTVAPHDRPRTSKASASASPMETGT